MRVESERKTQEEFVRPSAKAVKDTRCVEVFADD